MKPRNLRLRVGVLILTLVLLPVLASAQGHRHVGGHRGDEAVGSRPGPGVIVGRPEAVGPVVVPPVVRQPIIARVPVAGVGRSGFGTIPVRTGFGTPPVRTGFETAPFDARFGIQTHVAQVPVVIGRHQAFRARGFRAFKPRYVVGGAIVAGYPAPYPYAYLPQHGFTISSGGVYLPPVESHVDRYGAGGVSAGATTYFPGISSETGSSGGLSFEVSPAAAEVYVDGAYVGTVQDFWADREPLMVAPGRHWIELRTPGYRTVGFEVAIPAGQVVPYQGDLQPLRPY